MPEKYVPNAMIHVNPYYQDALRRLKILGPKDSVLPCRIVDMTGGPFVALDTDLKVDTGKPGFLVRTHIATGAVDAIVLTDSASQEAMGFGVAKDRRKE